MHYFDQNKEFPNLFNMVADLLAREGQPDTGYDAVLKLIDKKILLILQSLRLPYVDENSPQAIQTSGFFEKLIKKADSDVATWNLKHNSNVTYKLYLGGGVVRSLLAYVYKDIYDKLMEYGPIDTIKTTFNNKKISFGEYLKETIKTAEYHLVRDSIVKEHHEYYQVFGIGSDMDVYVSVDPSNKELENKLNFSVQGFINSAREKLQVGSGFQAASNSFLPFADVAIRNEGLKETINQGGSTLDWLSFLLTPTDKGEHRLQNPGKDLFDHSGNNILHDFIKGTYSYIIGNVDAKPKQIIRGLRALLEMPFLNIKDRTIIEKQIISLQGKELDTKAAEQTLKMIRNSYFSGGNNRAYRENDSLLKLLPKEYQPPIFLNRQQISNKRKISGSDRINCKLESMLISDEKFCDTYCNKLPDNKHMFYHATKEGQKMLGIFRGGFVSSENEKVAYGSGLYCTPEQIIANSYGNFIIPLQFNFNKANRIVNINEIGPDIKKDLEAEAKSKGCQDINELLCQCYNIDIIVMDDTKEFMVQNSSIFSPPSGKDYLNSLRNEVVSSLESILIENDQHAIQVCIANIKSALSISQLIDIESLEKFRSDVMSILLKKNKLSFTNEHVLSLMMDLSKDSAQSKEKFENEAKNLLATNLGVSICKNFAKLRFGLYNYNLNDNIFSVILDSKNAEAIVSIDATGEISSMILDELCRKEQTNKYQYNYINEIKTVLLFAGKLGDKLATKLLIASLPHNYHGTEFKNLNEWCVYCIENNIFNNIPGLLTTIVYKLGERHYVGHYYQERIKEPVADGLDNKILSLLVSLKNQHDTIIDQFYYSLAIVSYCYSADTKSVEEAKRVLFESDITQLLNKPIPNVNSAYGNMHNIILNYANAMYLINNDISEASVHTWQFMSPILNPGVDFSDNSNASIIIDELVGHALLWTEWDSKPDVYRVLTNSVFILFDNFTMQHKNIFENILDKLSKQKYDVKELSLQQLETILNKAEELQINTDNKFFDSLRDRIYHLKHNVKIKQ